MRDRDGMSDQRRPTHWLRQDVLRYYRDRALSETSTTSEDFAGKVAVAYQRLVPEHARTLDWPVPDDAGTYRDYALALGRLEKRIKRYVDGEVNLPVEIEEAWVEALPGPYFERCKAELARRYGYMPALAPDADPVADGVAVSRVLIEVGQMTQALATALADGRMTADDFNGPTDILGEIDQAAAAVASVRARVVEVLSDDDAKTTLDGRQLRQRAARP